jgi:virulence-associated protein E/primase-like protein/bifunctional DNA primase/polymerase-like protein
MIAQLDSRTHDASTTLRLQLRSNGYAPVPVNGKRPLMLGWQDRCQGADEQEIARWSRSQRECASTGILCGKVSGVDIDVLDEALSKRIIAKAIERLGPTPLTRIGRAPKTLLCYRLVMPIKKLSTPELFFADDANDAKATKVEILGDGQQVVAFGIHPETHAEYYWPERSPLDIHADDMPLVTAEALAAFVDEAEQMIRDAGGRTKAEIKAGVDSPPLVPVDTESADIGSARTKQIVDDLKTNAVRNANQGYEKPSRELIVSALAAVPNDLTYDNWIKMGYALRDGLGDAGFDVWCDFSATYPGNNAKITEDKWKSFDKRRSVTVATLFYWARNNGWRPPPPEWKKALKETEKGTPRAILANAIIALRLSPDWIGSLSHNPFTLETSLDDAPPWHTSGDWTPRVWTEHDDLSLTFWMQNMGIVIDPNKAAQAVEMVARDRIVHPVLDYLDGLKHDGTSRVANWLTDFLGADDTPYHREVGRAMLIAAIARIRDPGCKVDTVPILEGPQGAMKSTAIEKLFHPWFSDELADLGSKDAAMQMSGIWGIELAELDAMSRAEVSRTKAFISRRVDRYRPPFGRRVIERQRPCVFWGTTNASGYLKDETGGRRFWPIKIGTIDVTGLTANRDQLWAEAQELYRTGLPWWIKDRAVQVAAEEQQKDRYQGDVWDVAIAAYVTRMGDRDVTVVDVLDDLGVPIDRAGQAEQNRVARVLRFLGLRRRQRGTGAAKHWVYSKPVEIEDEKTNADVVPFPAAARTRF